MSSPTNPLTAAEALQQEGTVTKAAQLLNIPRTTFYSRLVSEIKSAPLPKLDIVEEHQLRRKVKELQLEAREAVARAAAEHKRAETISGFVESRLDPPEWLVRSPRGKTNRATITAFLSDTHFDEVVDPADMNGVNAYNREIAELRLRKFFDNTIMLARDYIAGVKLDGLVLPLGGDMVSGNIHEELERTNDAPILDTCVHWAEQICAGIELLLKFYLRIYIPCVVGNHGRLRKRPQYKVRAKDNYDWLIYKMVEKYFHNDSRVSFSIPEGPDCRYSIYSTRFLLTHGDQFTGGNGIGGIAVPIMRGDAKKQKREVALGRPYDHMLIGHWHQNRNLGTVFINGTTKGYDEFAAAHNFEFEPPQQALFVTTPERGVTIHAPIFVRSKQEKW